MRTLYPTIVVLSLAVGVMIIQMSGLPAILMGGHSVDLVQADDELEQSVGNNTGANNDSISAQGAPGGDSDGGFFQFVVSGIGVILDFASLALLLPETINALPLIPWWFAYPAGLAAQAITVIGIAETYSQREWT